MRHFKIPKTLGEVKEWCFRDENLVRNYRTDARGFVFWESDDLQFMATCKDLGNEESELYNVGVCSKIPPTIESRLTRLEDSMNAVCKAVNRWQVKEIEDIDNAAIEAVKQQQGEEK